MYRRWLLLGGLCGCGFNGPDTSLSPGIDSSPGGDGMPMVDARDDAPGDDGTVVDAAADAAGPDAFLPSSCPTGYSNLGNQTSLYKLHLYEGTFWTHHEDCMNDGAGLTHLVVIDDAAEADAVFQLFDTAGTSAGARYYIGAVQQVALSPQANTGWIDFAGNSLDGSALWAAPTSGIEPRDATDGIENHEEQLGAMFTNMGSTYLFDVAGDRMGEALCECDGQPVDARALTAVETDPNHP